MNNNTPDSSDARKCSRCGHLHHPGTRHCISCGHTPTLPFEDQLRLGLLKHHKKLEPEDGQFLLEVLKTFNLTLPRNAIEWRVAMRSDGAGGRIPFIPGSHPLYEGRVTCLLTDGVVAFFAIGALHNLNCPVFFGHLSNFTPDEPEKSDSEGRPKKETKKARALRELASED